MLRWSIQASLTALLVAGCAGERRDWAFVQSVGGMTVGTPHRTASGVMLPVAVDVSGTRAISTRPRALHSGLVVKEIVVRREGRTLGLALLTAAAGGPGGRAASGDVALGDLEPGRYAVVYVEPGGGRVDLGPIDVPP